MGKWNRKYPVFEVAIATRSYHPDGGGERMQEGDIIEVRPPSDGIGVKEGDDHLWLHLEGVEEEEIERLKDYLTYEHPGALEEPGTAPVLYQKSRYCIPFHRLQEQWPEFIPGMAREQGTIYQPALTIDDRDPRWFRSLAPRVPFSIHGLVFDKLTRRYL